jgi:hypothetical protein
VIPRPWRTDNGKSQLRTLVLQEGELLHLLPVPSLGLLLPPLGISCSINQATGSLLGHLVHSVHLCKLNLEEGDPSDKAFCLLVSRG